MPSDRTDPDTLARARRIHQACERHEAAWRAGARPPIEPWIEEAPESDRSELLTELLALEVEMRQTLGEQPSPREYQARFPGRGAEVLRAFRDFESEDLSIADTRTYPYSGDPSSARAGWERPPFRGLAGPGEDFEDFELLEEVGRGGMGIVFRARKRSLNCLVALKAIPSGVFASDAEKRRFLLEAEAAANLDHPNIVPVFEIDRRSGLYFTMKWVEGGHLGQHLGRYQADPPSAARLLSAVARAVHFAHEHGYLHRDLKPSNILIDHDGRPLVTDFGLARRLGQDSSLTHSGAVLGTPSYMAPEQASGQGSEVGRSADIYSLGAIFYELLTGRPPFRAPSVVETLILVLERDPIRPGRLRKGIPPEMEAICLKCLEKAPDDRYGSAEALADDVDRALRGDEVQAMSAGIRLRLRRWTRREPQLVSHLIGLGSILALTQFNYLTSRSPDPRLHLLVTAALLAWAGVSVVLQALARRAGRRQAIWPAWAVADSGFLTLSLWLLDGGASSMVVGYPLVIAASGLWFRLSLVWLSTALAEVGYGLLVLDGSLRGILDRQPDHPNIVFASIAVTGFVVARQVKRLQALSSYYEHRLPS